MPQVALMQHQIDLIMDDTSRFLGMVSGYRAGKTFALCHKAIRLSNLNSLAIAILEPTHGMVTRTLVPTMNAILYEIKLPFTHNKSEFSYTLHFPDGDKKIWLLSAENYDKAAGMTLSAVLFDEFDRMNFEVGKAAMEMMTSRVTKGECMQICALSTAESFNLMHHYFIGDGAYDESKNLIPGRRLIVASTYSNPMIPKEWFENMKNTHTEKQLRSYFNGEFVNFSTGNCYEQFDRNINITNKTVEDFPNHILHLGLDFNNNVMAAVVSVVDNEIIYVLDEFMGSQNTRTLILDIKKRYPDKTIYCYPDSSGDNASANADKSSIQLLKDAGFILKFNKANPRILLRVGSVNSMICNANNKRRLFVNINKAKKLTQAFEQQGFDKNGMPDKSKGLDHHPDAFGYFCAFSYPILGKSVIRIG